MTRQAPTPRSRSRPAARSTSAIPPAPAGTTSMFFRQAADVVHADRRATCGARRRRCPGTSRGRAGRRLRFDDAGHLRVPLRAGLQHERHGDRERGHADADRRRPRRPRPRRRRARRPRRPRATPTRDARRPRRSPRAGHRRPRHAHRRRATGSRTRRAATRPTTASRSHGRRPSTSATRPAPSAHNVDVRAATPTSCTQRTGPAIAPAPPLPAFALPPGWSGDCRSTRPASTRSSARRTRRR